ncbi:unnamed protein product, partial [Symbiodinium necroappetens]
MEGKCTDSDESDPGTKFALNLALVLGSAVAFCPSTYGATPGQSFRCVKDVACAIAVSGTALAESHRVQLLPAGSTCGADVSFVETFPNGRISASVLMASATQRVFEFGVAYQEGSFLVCFCPAYDSSDDSDVSKCNSNSEYCQDAGLLRVSGAESADIFHCVKGAFCTFNITGDMLQSGDHVQPIAFGGRCGSASAVSDFGILRPQAAGTVDTWSDEQAFSFGIANSGGRYEICYCANYDTSERTNSYDAASGAYTACDSVHGATGGEAFECVKNTHCSFTLSGFGLHGDDEVAGCEGASQSLGHSSAKLKLGVSERTVLELGLSETVQHRSFFEAALPRGYCASYDGPDEDLLSCSSDSDFTHEAGSLEVRGAFGAQSYACVKDVNCSVDALGFSLDGDSHVQMVRSSGLCGFSVVVTEFGASRVAATSGNSSYRSFDLAEATEAGRYVVCYCADYSAAAGAHADAATFCTQDAEFSHAAGTVVVRGPMGGEDQVCTAGVPCVLGTFHGQGLAVGNRIAFVLRQIYGSAGLVEVAMDSRGNCQTQGRDDEQGNGASYTGATLDSRSLAAYTMAQGQPPGCSVVETWAGYWMYVNVTAGMVVLLSKWSICYCADYDSTAVSTRITGESLSSLDRVIFVENGVSADCGVSEFDYRIARDGPKTVGGQWLMCYCAGYEGCLLPQHFTSLAGMLTVLGPTPSTQDQLCYAGKPCNVTFQGQGLGPSDQVAFIRSGGECGVTDRDTRLTGNEYVSNQRPVIGNGQYQPVQLSTQLFAQVQASLTSADLPQGGSWHICYCTANHGSCDDPADFAASAGTLVVAGLFAQDFACVAGAPCSIGGTESVSANVGGSSSYVATTAPTNWGVTIAGPTDRLYGEGIAAGDRLMLSSAGDPNICGQDSPDTRLLSGGHRAVDSAWVVPLAGGEAGDLPLGGQWKLCFCVGDQNSCGDPSDFVNMAGILTVKGPSSNDQNQSCTAGQSCTLGPFVGEGLATGDQESEVQLPQVVILSILNSFLPTPDLLLWSERSGMEMLRLRDPNAAIFLSQIFAEAVGRRWLAQALDASLSLPATGGETGFTRRGGVWKMCYCADYFGCAEDGFFTARLGYLTILGPSWDQHATCTAGLACSSLAQATKSIFATYRMKRQQGFGPIEGQGLSDQDLVAFVEGSAAKEGSESAEASHVAQVTESIKQWESVVMPGRTIFDATFGSFVQLDAGLMVNLTAAQLPRGGVWKMCYCTGGGSGGCTAIADFGARLGLLTVLGPSPNDQDATCFAGSACDLVGAASIQGQSLSTDDKVLLVSGLCGSGSVDAAAGFGEAKRLTSLGVGPSLRLAAETWRAAELTGGTWQICHCIESSGGCASVGDFTAAIGMLTVIGPNGTSHVTCHAGAACSFWVLGEGIAASDQVIVVAKGGSCGTSAADTSIWQGSALTIAADGTVSVTASDLPLGGQWLMCYCSSSTTCLQDLDFTGTVGMLSVVGPAPTTQTQICVTGVACTLGEYRGFGISGADYVGIIDCTPDPGQIVDTCCSSYVWSSFPGGDRLQQIQVTSNAAYVQISAPQVLPGGQYAVCHCMGGVCSGAVAVSAFGLLEVLGPSSVLSDSCAAGASCTLVSLAGQGIVKGDQ